MDVVQQYTYGSLVAYARDRKQHKNCQYTSSTRSGGSFSQTENFEEAMGYAINGWDLALEQYKIEDGTLVGGITKLTPSLAGCLPHVQNHIMGFPEEMYNLYDNREYNLPTLDIVVNLAYNCGIESQDALDFGKSIVNYINTMASNYNIRLTGIFGQRLDNHNMYDLVTLKDFDNALVINNIAFAFHPSFFRRLWFAVFEGKEQWEEGYGHPIRDTRKIAREYLGGGKSDKTVYFKNLADIERYKFEPDNIEYFTETF